jgi:hypothetical protein
MWARNGNEWPNEDWRIFGEDAREAAVGPAFREAAIHGPLWTLLPEFDRKLSPASRHPLPS